jgi:hypothetical protein
MVTRSRASVEEWRKRVRQALKNADASFRGEYASELKDLLGLSQEEIDRLTPDATDLAVYHQLITVVEEASRSNVSQAQLRSQIKGLGAMAVQIAKKVTGLAAILGA